MRNVLRASFSGTRARVGELELEVARPLWGEGYLVVPPEGVLLAEAPLRSSARNAFPATIREVRELPTHVEVELEAGSVRLQATITHASLRERGWRPGSEVWLAFKATALRVIPP